MLESFEAALRLDRAALRDVLARGRPEERVWAIWALALAIDDAGALVQRVRHEPDVGVRRTLAVLLAGHGQVELLVALATDDPALAVRASAMQLVTRLAIGGQVDPRVVEAALGREPEIRAAVLGAIGRGAPPFLVAIAERLLRDRAPELRFEAFEALLRIGAPDTHAIAIAWMRGVSDIAAVCDAWLRASTVESLVDAFAEADASTRMIVLARLREPSWPLVERLVGGDRTLLEPLLDRADIVIPPRVLAKAILEGAYAGFVPRLTRMLEAAGQGHALHAALRAAIDADADDGTRLRLLARRVRDYAQALDIPGAIGVIDELADQHPVEQLVGLENALAGWLARDVPPDLQRLMPPLAAHVATRLAQLRDGPNVPANRQLPGAGARRDVRVPWIDELPALRRLQAALRPFLAHSR